MSIFWPQKALIKRHCFSSCVSFEFSLGEPLRTEFQLQVNSYAAFVFTFSESLSVHAKFDGLSFRPFATVLLDPEKFWDLRKVFGAISGDVRLVV